jgi:hypothetical protein
LTAQFRCSIVANITTLQQDSNMNQIAPVNPEIKPGVYLDIPNESYHAGPGISKSGLWTIATKTPAHFKYGERKENKAFDFGEACHLAILQPDLSKRKSFEDRKTGAVTHGKTVLSDASLADTFCLRLATMTPHWQFATPFTRTHG